MLGLSMGTTRIAPLGLAVVAEFRYNECVEIERLLVQRSDVGVLVVEVGDVVGRVLRHGTIDGRTGRRAALLFCLDARSSRRTRGPSTPRPETTHNNQN